MAKAIINGNEIFGNVHMGEGGDVANPNIADVYDPTQTYNTGDRRIYNDVLYVCNDDNVTGAWDSTKWDSATIDEIISALTAADIPYSAGVSVADKIDEFENKITTQTVDGVSWTIKRNGKFYEMWADISIDTSAVTPIQWGSLYIYRNPRLTAYQLPVKLAKKVCDLSFSNGVVATMTAYYTDISRDENGVTSADIIRPTTTTSTIVVHKYIRGYVN